MSVEKTSTTETQARLLAQKKRALEDEGNALEVERSRVQREGTKQITAQQEKNSREIVEISKAGEKQAEAVKKLNLDRVKDLNRNSLEHFEKLSATAADEIRRLDANAMKAIDDHRTGSMEKVLSAAGMAEDPFYRIKTLAPVMSDTAESYDIRLTLPEHEARNVMISAEGQAVKLSLARRFQDSYRDPAGAGATKTSSFQTVVDQVNLPGPFNSRGIAKDYRDGVLTITVPKPPKPLVGNA